MVWVVFSQNVLIQPLEMRILNIMCGKIITFISSKDKSTGKQEKIIRQVGGSY